MFKSSALEGERARERGRQGEGETETEWNRKTDTAGEREGGGILTGVGQRRGGASGDTCIIAPTATTNCIGIRNLEVGIRDSRVTRGPRPRLHYRLLTLCRAAYWPCAPGPALAHRAYIQPIYSLYAASLSLCREKERVNGEERESESDEERERYRERERRRAREKKRARARERADQCRRA